MSARIQLIFLATFNAKSYFFEFTIFVKIYAEIFCITIRLTAPSFDSSSTVAGYKIYFDFSTNGTACVLIDRRVLH